MADLHVFGVTNADPFGIAVANFKLNGVTRGSTLSSDTATDGLGEFIPATDIVFGEKENISTTYQAAVNGAVGVLTAAVGADAAVALESVSINTVKGVRATGSASGHQHIGGTNTVHNDRERTVTFPAFNGFGASDFGLDLGVPASSLQAGSYRIDVGHSDESDADGNFLCGASHGEKHTASFEAIDATAWTVPTGWKRVEDTPTPSQAEGKFETTKLTIFKTVAGPVAE